MENELSCLKSQYNHVVTEYENACAKIELLEKQIHDESVQEAMNKQVVLEDCETKIKILKEALQDRNDSIKNLKGACEAAQAVASKLNKELCDNKLRFKEEKAALVKEFKSEAKQLKKELGKANSKNLKLLKKIDSDAESLEVTSETTGESIRYDGDIVNNTGVSCSLCATPIVNYKPKYFMGVEVNAACSKCEDKDDIYDEDNSGSQILLTRKGFNYRPVKGLDSDPTISKTSSNFHEFSIIRDPLPPPFPTLTPLINESSNYHSKILDGSLGWGSTCEYCYRIDHKNYGCESCVWMKWFGELHGYPDINPYTYRKYLIVDESTQSSEHSGSQAT